MLLHETTGRQLREARVALGLSPGALAALAGINRISLRVYESHGDDVPNAHTKVLGKLTRYLQEQGVEFCDDGSVRLDRAAPTIESNVINDGAAL